MSSTKERIEILVQRGERQRLELAASFDDFREELGRRRLQWRIAGWMAAGLAAAATGAYRLFGKGSLAARVGRYSSAASLLLGLGRAAMRLRRFF